MKSFLLTVMFLGLVAVLRAQEDPLEDSEEYTGKWYVKAMVHNGSNSNHELPRMVFPITITALEGGNLEVKIILGTEGHCNELKFKLKKTKMSGQYTAFHGKKKVRIEKLSSKDHYAIFCEGRHHRAPYSMGKLLGRDPEDNPDAMEEFMKLAKSRGFREENIFEPESSEHCEPDSD